VIGDGRLEESRVCVLNDHLLSDLLLFLFRRETKVLSSELGQGIIHPSKLINNGRKQLI
jgi:hypothetical protein